MALRNSRLSMVPSPSSSQSWKSSTTRVDERESASHSANLMNSFMST